MLPIALIALLPQVQDVPAPFEPDLLPLAKSLSIPTRLVTCELDGDGVEEVLISGLKDGLGVVRENPDGTLQVRRVPLPWIPRDVATGDLDGDGDTDVALVSEHELFVLENLGSGTFASATWVASDAFLSVELGDLDGDGRLDLLGGAERLVKPYLNQGGLEFTPLAWSPVPFMEGPFVAGDWNADGRADLVVASDVSGVVLSVLGDGSGGFLPVSTWFVEGHIEDLRAGDLDADGLVDVVVLGHTVSSPYFRGTPSGAFVPAPAALEFPQNVLDACIADLDDDGRPDVGLAGFERPLVDFDPLASPRAQVLPYSYVRTLTAARTKADAPVRLIAVVSSNPSGFGALKYNLARFVLGPRRRVQGLLATTPLGTNLDKVHVDADFDGDGHLDRVLGTTDAYTPFTGLLRGTPEGWSSEVEPLGFPAQDAGAADVDGDGHMDLVSRTSSLAAWSVRYGDGSGAFSAPAPFAAGLAIASNPSTTDPLLPDLDGDGRCDVVELEAGVLTVYLGQGDGTFSAGSSVQSTGLLVRDVVDVDGDGAHDVVVQRSHFGDLSDEFWFGDGQGRLAGVATSPAVENETSALIAAGDLDGDGDFDLVTCSGELSLRRLAIHPGLPEGGWGLPTVQRIRGRLLYGTIEDIDGDGHRDLTCSTVTAVHGLKYPEVWRGDGRLGLRVWSQPAWVTRTLNVHDVDDDGLPELIGDDAILRRPAR